MKKLISVLLIAVMLLSLAACKSAKQDQAADGADPTEAVKETEAPTAEPEATEPEETLPPTEPDPTPEPTEAPEPFDVSLVYEQPERPMIAQLEPGSYVRNEGESLETWSTVYYLTEDGRLLAFGDNGRYQLGAGNTEMSTEAVEIMDGVKSIACGTRLFALKEDGTLWTWGIFSPWEGYLDSYGSKEPVKILDNVASYDESFALTENGELWLIENGEGGAVAPSMVMEGVASFSSAGRGQVSIVTTEGELHSCYGGYAHNDDGTTTLRWNDRLAATDVKQAYCVGNFYLGTDDVLYGFVYNENYEAVPNALIENVYKAYPCFGGVYAIKYDGSLWGWCNESGAGSWFPSGCLKNAGKLLDRVVHVSAQYEMDEDMGVTYAIALTADGELYGWGPNWFGELAAVDSYSMAGEPQDTAAKMADDVKMFWSDGVNTFIIKDDGSLWGCGYNGAKGSRWEDWGIGLDPDEGRLGDGTCETHEEDGRNMFVKIADNAERICQRLGYEVIIYDDGTDGTYTFARVFMLDTDGSVWAWGYNKDGCLQRRGPAYVLSPVKIIEGQNAGDR